MITLRERKKGFFEVLKEDAVVGWVSLQTYEIEGEECIHIDRIDVDEKYQGQGIGTEALHQIAKDHPWRTYLAPDNEDARRLYERLGEPVDGSDPIDDNESYMDVGFGVYKIC